MFRPLPPLSAVRAFEAAARHLSFVRAGDELGVTSRAVSHQVKILEHWVGRPLFERRASGVVLTAAGRDFAGRVRQAFDNLTVAGLAVRDPNIEASVSIRSQFSVAARWLAPRLRSFRAAYPHIQITVSALSQSSLVNQAAPEMSISPVLSPRPGFRVDRLLDGHLIPVAAPALVTAKPQRMSAADLLAEPVLETRYITWMEPGWMEWFTAAGIEETPPRPAFVFNLAHLAIEARMDGAGFALAPDFFIERELAEGRFLQVADTTLPMNVSYDLATPEANLARTEVAIVRDWLLGHRHARAATG